MKRLILALTLVAAALQSAAQTVPLSDIRKPAIPTHVSDSLERFNLSFDYSIFNRPYADLYDFNPYEALLLNTKGPNRLPYFYAKLGLQYPFIPTGEIYFQTRPKNDFCLGIYGRHNSFIGTRPDVASDASVDNSRMTNSVGGAFTYDWATGEFIFDAQYNYNRHSFDAGEANSLSTDGNLLISMNINSAHVEDKSVFYDITAKYRNSNMGLTTSAGGSGNVRENYIKVGGDVGATFDIHRIGVNMNIEFSKYTGMKEYSSGVVELSPVYEIENRVVSARIGAKFGTTYAIGEDKGGQDLGVENNFFPEIDARFKLVDKVLWVRTVVTGGEDLNQLSSLTDRCPVVDLASGCEFGVRRLDARLSVESVIRGRLAINLLGSYVIYDNKLFFAPMTDADASLCRVQAQYMDVNSWSFGAETFWKSQDLTLSGKVQYHMYSRRYDEPGEVTEFPKLTAEALLRYSFRERLIASFDLSYRSKVSGTALGAYEVPALLDASVNVNYLIGRNFSIFAKVGNVFNQRNQYMPMYLEPGRNWGGGICVNF